MALPLLSQSRINVDLEFISPENTPACIRSADELCLLLRHHNAEEKVMEVEKMTSYGISAAIEEIRNLTYQELILDKIWSST